MPTEVLGALEPGTLANKANFTERGRGKCIEFMVITPQQPPATRLGERDREAVS